MNEPKTNAPTRRQEFFNIDRPITSHTQDKLNRDSFAVSLATAIDTWAGTDSLIIAIYGEWGIGKTSLKNLLLEHLTNASNPPQILEFTPWAWAAQDPLFTAFFDDLATTVGTAKKDNNKKTIGRLRAYAARLRLRAAIYQNVPKIIGAVTIILGVIGIPALVTTNPYLRGTAIAIFGTAFLLGIACSISADIAEKVADAISAIATANSKTLQEQKNELANDLRKLNNNVLVIMDDIDRLTPNETASLFQLVKTNADFPKIIYLLLCQRDTVEHALEIALRVDGKQYLKKIVNVGFDIPVPSPNRVLEILTDDLGQLFAADPANFDEQRWAALFTEGIAPFFTTLRDVKRFIGELTFHAGVFRPDDVLEVNPIDLIGLEVLRHFEPRVYHHIPSAKDQLTTTAHRIKATDSNKQYSATIDELIGNASDARATATRHLLAALFPEPTGTPGIEPYPQWERALRVAHDRIFDRYFQLTIPANQLSEAQVQRTRTLLVEAEQLTNQFRALARDGLLEAMLHRLATYKEDLNRKNALSLMTALINIGDDLSSGRTGAFSIPPLDRATQLVHSLLTTEQDHEQRAKLLQQATDNSTGLYLPVHILRLEESEERRKADPEALALRTADIPALRAATVQRIRAHAPELDQQRHLGRLLHMWGLWGGFSEPQGWVRQFIKTDDGLLRFLRAFAYAKTSWEAGQLPVTEWHMRADNIAPLVGIEELSTRLDQIDITAQPEDLRHAVQAFREMRERHDKGITDEPISPLMR